MYWEKETEKLFHYNFSILNIGEDWKGKEKERGERRKGKKGVLEEREEDREEGWKKLGLIGFLCKE